MGALRIIEGYFPKDLGEACGAVEKLLRDAVRIASERQKGLLEGLR